MAKGKIPAALKAHQFKKSTATKATPKAAPKTSTAKKGGKK